MASAKSQAVESTPIYDSLEPVIENVSTVTEVVTQGSGSSALMEFFTAVDLGGFIARVFEAVLTVVKTFILSL